MRLLLTLLLAGCGTPFVGGPGGTRSDIAAAADTPACVEGAYLETELQTDTGSCGSAIHAFGGPVDARIEIGVLGLDGPAWVRVETVGGELIAARPVSDASEALVVDLPWSGEFIAHITPDTPSAFTITRTCVDGCDTPWTRYPIFLMHGMAGTDAFLDRIDYFYGVGDALFDEGYDVYAFAVDPFQISAVRSLTWREHLDAVVAQGRHRRFNLVGHSQGGLDARYVAAHLDPDHQVASVLTVGTPHRGVPAIDVLAGTVAGNGVTQAMVDGTFDALAILYGLDSDQDILGQMAGFGEEAMAVWNDETPDRPDVYYASWSGQTCQIVDLVCLWQTNGEVVSPLLGASHLMVAVLDGPNDGLVSVRSAAWGVHYGTLGADHLDEVGQVAGLTSLAFDHVDFYLDEAAWMGTLGL